MYGSLPFHTNHVRISECKITFYVSKKVITLLVYQNSSRLIYRRIHLPGYFYFLICFGFMLLKPRVGNWGYFLSILLRYQLSMDSEKALL